MAAFGCSADSTPVMPNVVGDKLDVAKDEVKNSGFEDDVEVDGGGMFGIVVESNWTVCSQDPAGGEPINATPTLSVERSCDEAETGATETIDPSEPPETPVEAPSLTESIEPTETASPTETTETPSPTETPLPAVLTAKNNKDFAAILKESECSRALAAFSKKYRGKKIGFDGSIIYIEKYGRTLDMTVANGDEGSATANGPIFQFKNVAVANPQPPGLANVAVDMKFHFVATVGEYNMDSCLFALRPLVAQRR